MPHSKETAPPILQKDSDGNFRLIDTCSKKLNKLEVNYSIFRKEGCALALAGVKFRKYLIEPSTTANFYIDSRSLYLMHRNIQNNSTFNVFLQNLLTIYRPASLNFIEGSKNVFADFIDRVSGRRPPKPALPSHAPFVCDFCSNARPHEDHAKGLSRAHTLCSVSAQNGAEITLATSLLPGPQILTKT